MNLHLVHLLSRARNERRGLFNIPVDDVEAVKGDFSTSSLFQEKEIVSCFGPRFFLLNLFLSIKEEIRQK